MFSHKFRAMVLTRTEHEYFFQKIALTFVNF
jgi:hypothetical protein